MYFLFFAPVIFFVVFTIIIILSIIKTAKASKNRNLIDEDFKNTVNSFGDSIGKITGKKRICEYCGSMITNGKSCDNCGAKITKK